MGYLLSSFAIYYFLNIYYLNDKNRYVTYLLNSFNNLEIKMNYDEFKSCGKLRSMLNKTYNSRIITPELQAYLDYRLDDEAKFHESGWKQAIVVSLYDFIIKCDSKRSRLEKVLKMLDILSSYKNKTVEAAIEAAGKDKGYWEPREVEFPNDINPRLSIYLGEDYGQIRKATKVSEPCALIDLEVDEYKDGLPTGKIILVTYDKESHRRFLHGYKKTREELLRAYYEEDEENGIL